MQIIPLCHHLKGKPDGANIQPLADWPRCAEWSAVDRMSESESFASGQKNNANFVRRAKAGFFDFCYREWQGIGWWAARKLMISIIRASIDAAIERTDRM